MDKKRSRRRFSREFKLAGVRAMISGVNVSQLAQDLSVSRMALFRAVAGQYVRRSWSKKRHPRRFSGRSS